MRRAAILVAVALQCGCKADAPKVAAGGEHVDCAIGQDAQFAPVCAVERGRQDGRKVIVVRHPDGGFRRFLVLNDGHGLAAADGADVAQVAVAANRLEVSVGQDRYRFPFTVKSHDSNAR